MAGERPGEESVLQSSSVPEPVFFLIRGSSDENESGERLLKKGKTAKIPFQARLAKRVFFFFFHVCFTTV